MKVKRKIKVDFIKFVYFLGFAMDWSPTVPGK